MQHQAAFISNVPSDIEKSYTSTYFELDPLNPEKFRNTDIKLATLDSQISQEALLSSRYYLEFMKTFQHRYVLDMFFRNSSSEIIAVISLLRSKSQGDFTAQEITLLETIHDFMEFSLNTVYLPKRDAERSNLQARYQLTDRELDVVELLISGASNKEIARRIDMGLATLKTHLNHIFRKTSVQSRTELTAKILAEL